MHPCVQGGTSYCAQSHTAVTVAADAAKRAADTAAKIVKVEAAEAAKAEAIAFSSFPFKLPGRSHRRSQVSLLPSPVCFHFCGVGVGLSKARAVRA